MVLMTVLLKRPMKMNPKMDNTIIEEIFLISESLMENFITLLSKKIYL